MKVNLAETKTMDYDLLKKQRGIQQTDVACLTICFTI